jgi:hypothetical protein
MNVFAIIQQPSPDPGLLPAKIKSVYPSDHFELSGNAWLVAASATAEGVSDSLGISDGQSGAAVVVQIGDYFGRAEKNIWDWIKTKWEAAAPGGTGRSSIGR